MYVEIHTVLFSFSHSAKGQIVFDFEKLRIGLIDFLSYSNRLSVGFFVPMNLQAQILQQQSTVRMLEKLVAAKRATSADLEQAKRRLVDLKEQEQFKPVIPRPKAEPTAAVVEEPFGGPVLEGDEYARMQAELSGQLDTLSRKRANLSNQLHLVPESVACPEQTGSILALTAQIEALWDKKRYLERNHRLPPEPTTETSTLPALPGNDEGRYQLAYEKRRLIDKRSKLRGKLENPKARPSKRAEWETELAQCDLKIREIDVQLI